jgi:hypothetical protein
MEGILAKYGKWIAILLGVIGLIPSLVVFFVEGENLDKTVEFGLYMTYIISLVGILAAIGGAVRGILINPNGVRSTAMGVGFLVAILVVSYLFADGSDYMEYQKMKMTESGSRWVSTGLNALNIMIALSTLAVVFSALYRAGLIRLRK